MVILIKSVILRNQLLGLKTWKLWQSSTTIELTIFLNCCTRFLLTNVYKRVLKSCFILFKAWVICQNKKRPGFYTLTETRVINNSKSNKKKIPNTLLQTLVIVKVNKISAKNIKLWGSWTPSKFSVLQTNNFVCRKW